MNPSTRRRLGSANVRKAILNHLPHKFCNFRPKHYVYSIGCCYRRAQYSPAGIRRLYTISPGNLILTFGGTDKCVLV